MPELITIIAAIVAVDIVILALKCYGKFVMKEDKISWKLIALIQIPILVILYLFFISFEATLIILISAIVICVVLGIFCDFRGKRSATQPIAAEIIDINRINYGRRNTEYMYTLTVKYTVNKVEYIAKNLKGYSELDENMKIGNQIIIKYNPKNPNDVRMP